MIPLVFIFGALGLAAVAEAFTSSPSSSAPKSSTSSKADLLAAARLAEENARGAMLDLGNAVLQLGFHPGPASVAALEAAKKGVDAANAAAAAAEAALEAAFPGALAAADADDKKTADDFLKNNGFAGIRT